MEKDEEVNHEIALCIVNNPGVSNRALAMECKCDQSMISKIKEKLNIPASKRPINCKG